MTEEKQNNYNIREAAEKLKKSPSTIRNWIRDGHLPVINIGREIRIKQETIDDILANGITLNKGTA